MADPTVARASDALARDDFQSDLMPPAASGRPGDQPADHPADVIIRSKVRAPALRDSTLPRPRLLGWLDVHADERVRVLAAEAGFGKTTLLADWARRTIRPVRWLKLDPVDAEWASFISYLIAAFQEGRPEFGDATQRLLGHVATLGVTRDQATSQLIAELGHAISEPTVLILDDVQHVQGNGDVQAIIERLIERAPQMLTFILSGRGKPDVRLGRLTAQGSVESIGTDDLRFTRQETVDLFTHGYRFPLDGDLIGVVDERTEGWGASLQLLYTSIRGQRPNEVREFIASLKGGSGPLYAFLAEEVLGRQTPDMQRLLLHASILDRIVPRLVSAALSVLPDPPVAASVEQALVDADELGLLSRSAEQSSSRRFHPLLREFLVSHLAATIPPDRVRAMHLRVAEVAEELHWPTSAHHYIEAGEGEQAMRVIGDATITAIGTGGWGAAVQLLERVPTLEMSPAIKAIVARGMATAGHAEQAVVLLESIDTAVLESGRDRAIVRLTLANALARTPRDNEIADVLSRVVGDPEAPPVLHAVARAWRDLANESDNRRAMESMTELILFLKSEGLSLYTALAHHNLAISQLANADFDGAISNCQEALRFFAFAEEDEGITASSHMAIAHALFEKGEHGEALARALTASELPSAQPDVFADLALLQAWVGLDQDAAGAIVRGWTLHRAGSYLHSATDALHSAEATLALARGNRMVAASLAGTARVEGFDHNQAGLSLTLRAATTLAAGISSSTPGVVTDYAEDVRRRRLVRWMPHVRLLEAISKGDDQTVVDFFANPTARFESVLLVLADNLEPVLERFETTPLSLDRHVRKWPERWRPILRRVVMSAESGDGFAAAALLAGIGVQSDVANLLAWEKRQKKWLRDRRFSDDLARRVSPTLVIHDLGRSMLTLGPRQIPVGGLRRRAATLLLYLVSRPRQSATREQVLDALWPEQDPIAAGNSLHQTLFFLRKELVVRPKDGKPLVEYVPVQSELVYLVPELVHVDSAAFVRQAIEVGTRHPGGPEALALIQSYEGPFAPEFEYEEWALTWREQVHSAFLHLSEQAARARLPERAAEATAVLRHALEVDSSALELKALLAAAMHLSGSHAAGRHLFRQYELEYEREFGEAPPSLAEVLAAFGDTG